MNCVEFENRLRASIEKQETSYQDELREHAESCGRCDALWQESTFLDQVIALWKSDLAEPDSVEPDLVDSVIRKVRNDRLSGECARCESVLIRPSERMTQVASDAAATRKSGRGVAVVVIAVAAMLLVALDLALFRPATDLVWHRPSAQFADHLDARNRSYEEFQLLLEETRSSYAALTQEAVQAVPDLTGWLTALRPAQQTIETNDEPASPWTRDLQQSLEPIGRDLGKAIDFLYNALPVDAPATS